MENSNQLVITAKVKLLPTEEQKILLLDTLRTIKDALNYTSKVAYDNGLLSAFKKLQEIVYHDLREQFGLKSQMACNVCSVVAGSYASMKSNGEKNLAIYKVPKFQYSYNRDYSFTKDGLLSIGTLDGRIKVPFIQTAMDQYLNGDWEFGTATLVYKKGKFYLHIAVKKVLPDFDETSISNVVGADMGINYLITAIDSSDQMMFVSGKQIKNKKANYIRLRKELQSRGTKSARKKLKRIAGKENRWQSNVNHCLSKALIQFAGKNSLIIIEDLTGIRLSAPVVRHNRFFHSSWAFAQLRQMIEYKALLNDIKVMAVDPKYTSQKCPKCGYTHKTNRNHSIHTFICKKCGYTSNDDRIGAMNLRQVGIEYHSEISK